MKEMSGPLRKIDCTMVQCLMLTCMIPELQKCFELQSAHDMIKAMDALYKINARSERYEIMKTMIECKMAEGRFS